MHVLPRVGELHERFSDVLSVVGVHTGKFSAERRTERIAAAADRLSVRHAIVNDRHYRVWRSYAVQAWPTIAVVDAEGYLVRVQAGEFDTEAIAEVIAHEAGSAEAKGVLVRGPERYLDLTPPGGDLLRYPSRAIEADGTLFVSDAGHGRVIAVELDASGLRGHIVREWSGFGEPQGLAIAPSDPASASGVAGGVFVADRAGHSVWRLGPGAGEQRRVAGTGSIAEHSIEHSGDATDTPLRSPWGLLRTGDGLLVSMAGSHQLFSLDLGDDRSISHGTGSLVLVAGTGAEDLRDGAAHHAALAQPTGLCSTEGDTYVADCETSAVRGIGVEQNVRTVVGTGLFEFGDRDGVGDDVLLQHCQDVAWHAGSLAVADTYNDRLKRVDPVTRECAPWPGEVGEAGALREPNGVSATAAGGLLVTDTGNHRIVRVLPDGSLAPIKIEDGE